MEQIEQIELMEPGITSRVRDAAVIGAGVAGSSAAKALADRGWDVVLIDGRRFPRHKVCGEFLSPESRGMLEAFGLIDTVQSLRPAEIDRARLWLSRGRPVEAALPGGAWGVSRYALDRSLQLAAIEAGVELLQGVTVTTVCAEDGGYRLAAKGGGFPGQAIRARAVIAAWGGRRGTGAKEPRPPNEAYIGVKTHYEGIEGISAVELFFFPGGYMGISPIEDGRVNVAALLKQDAFRDKESSVLGWIRAAGRRNPRLRDLLERAVPVPGTQAAVAPVRLHSRPLAWDTVPCIGDAAVMMPPLCGDGMSMALRSASLCSAWADAYLRGELTLEQWRDAYSRALSTEFSGPLRVGRLIHKVSGLPVLPGMLAGLSRLIPSLPAAIVRATRL
ncbi:NAD(P)/FAD-dependent oxidoreductase [Paenibacillus filicis]|uniref:NAD(P)/FAD-dependent oxidoreductase n=1 Tax=Paenibacillus gyeongsangnamensis TaxID=3388067 RepID=A0ABT4Q4U8_9BACL|nr:NAD(P)/FAD-dependent oxidoreductase [Paenibacillus filicis]MCZ8511890.1 NAD(P)/FAD-dependent oxidoreductase [Paenibacillus filicis]